MGLTRAATEEYMLQKLGAWAERIWTPTGLDESRNKSLAEMRPTHVGLMRAPAEEYMLQKLRPLLRSHLGPDGLGRVAGKVSCHVTGLGI
ncbi:hypothetical protein MRX96_030683 [Rhipicephalus microplus]